MEVKWNSNQPLLLHVCSAFNMVVAVRSKIVVGSFFIYIYSL